MGWIYLALPVALSVGAAFWTRSRSYRRAGDTLHRTLRPWLLPVFVAVAAVLAAPSFAGRGPVVISTYAIALVWSTVLAFIDFDVRRLPDALTLPAYLVAAVALTACSVVTQDWTALLRAAASAGIAVALFFLAALFSPGADGLGLGDVKLSGVLAALLGWIGWTNAVMGLLSGFIIGGVVALALLVTRRVDRRSHMSFGPAMIAGAYLWCLLAPPG